jgi:hypothetical protein
VQGAETDRVGTGNVQQGGVGGQFPHIDAEPLQYFQQI